jgi:sec-independent protein translocase protein TatA
MLSIPDMAILGAAALLLFGPEQLPKVMRKTGQVMREIQNTSQSFIREMERAADTYEPPDASKTTVPPYDTTPWEPNDEHATEPAVVEAPVGEKLAEPRPAPEAALPSTPPAPPAPSHPAEPSPQGDHSPHV